jgi:histidinol-phosphate phosphatase family protein
MKPRNSIIFIDRDGTINHEVDLLKHKSQLKLIEGSAEAIKLLNACGYTVVIVTNQPQVAKGICTEEDVKNINNELIALLKSKGANIDAIYYCPHHPEKGHAGENAKYKIDCECRKPKIGMLVEAAKRFGIDLANCYIVGDQTRDILAAKNAGCKSILVKTGYGGTDGRYPSKPDYTCENLLDATKVVVGFPKKAVIIAGGLGKRLAPLTESVPKPMLPLKGKPVLEHSIEWLKKNGITEIIICTGYLSHKVEDHFKDGKKFGVNITYSVEKEELGTGGALKNAQHLIGYGTFIMLYGDLIVDMDLNKFVSFHKSKNSLGTLSLHKSDHPYDSDMVECDKDGRILRFLGKPKPGQKFENMGNAGVYCFESSVLDYFPEGKSMLDKEALPDALKKGADLYGYLTNEKIIDIGTHDRYGKHK